MPVLWKRHFLLLWYCKKYNEVIMYDSTSPVYTYLVSSIKRFLLSLLSNFCSPPPSLKVDHMVEQKDSSSCGACACDNADAIASNILEVHHSDFHADDYRVWILFALLRHSKRYRMLTKTFSQNEHCAEIGRTNFGNNCWFYAVIQAVQRFLPRSGSREMIQRYAEHTVEGIIHRLVSKTEAKDGSLLAAIKSVCEKFQWNINEHQDATEFYMK